MDATGHKDSHTLLLLTDDKSLYEPALSEIDDVEPCFVLSTYKAVSDFSQKPADLAVVDLEAFPDTGPECISLFRDLGNDTYIVATFSGHHRRQSLQALESGADAVLIHPFYPRELAALLRRGSARMRASQEREAGLTPVDGSATSLAAGASSLVQQATRAIKDRLIDIGGDTDQPTAIQEAVKVIQRKTDELAEFAEQLRVYSYTSPATRSAMDLNELSVNLLDDVLSGSQQINVQKTLNAGPSTVWGDPHLLEAAFRYVMRERVRHIQTGGTLLIETTGPENENVKLSIWDNGRPLAEKRLRNLYEPFAVGSSTSPEAGLAYPIARNIARIHGGEFKIASNEEKGTRATFVLPAHRPGHGKLRNSVPRQD